jgi:plastocyanin
MHLQYTCTARKEKESAMSMETKKEKDPAMNVEATQTHLFSRQPPSVLGRIAFWAFLVGGLGGLGGAIALTIFSGSPSQDIVITTVVGLASAGILATRFRWAPLVTTLLGGYNLYLVFTEPYVVESLVHPKTDPQGGFGHFVGVVIISAVAIIAFGGSIGAAVQNYRQGSRQAPRWLPSALSLVAGLVIGAIFIGAIAQESLATGTTYTNGVPTVHMGAGSFLQPSVTIPKGSKLTLVDDVAALHILANGSWQNGVPKTTNEPDAPRVNNVQVKGGSAEIGPFSAAGTYHIYCEVHQGMNLEIIVQ